MICLASKLEVYSEGKIRSQSVFRGMKCAECNCTRAICISAETSRECRGCSQVANVSAECCCWQAAHGVA